MEKCVRFLKYATSVLILSFFLLLFFRNKNVNMSKGNNTANGSDDVYIYPENNKCIATKGNFSVEHLFHFESTNERHSRPPSAMSMRPMSPTNDLSRIYDRKHIDSIFGVQR